MIQRRVEALQEEQKSDVNFRKQEDEKLAKDVKVDELERQIKV